MDVRGGKASVSLKGVMVQECNVLLASIEKLFPVAGLRVRFSRGQMSLQLNGLFNNDSVHGMLERKDYQSFDM